MSWERAHFQVNCQSISSAASHSGCACAWVYAVATRGSYMFTKRNSLFFVYLRALLCPFAKRRVLSSWFSLLLRYPSEPAVCHRVPWREQRNHFILRALRLFRNYFRYLFDGEMFPAGMFMPANSANSDRRADLLAIWHFVIRRHAYSLRSK